MTDKLLQLYVEALKIHIGTKTKCNTFHKFTEEVYDWLFEVFHSISEKLEDINKWEYTVSDLEKSKQRIYDICEEIKSELEDIKWDYTTWFDNLARGLIDKVEFICWNAKSFIEEEEKEEEYKEETKIIPKKFGKLPNKL